MDFELRVRELKNILHTRRVQIAIYVIARLYKRKVGIVGVLQGSTHFCLTRFFREISSMQLFS